MPLFVCAEVGCNNVDNSACAPGYWTSVARGAPPRCTVCVSGEWHGHFELRKYDRAADGPLGAGRRIISRGMESDR